VIKVTLEFRITFRWNGR